jgi:hypothetical protein
MWGATPRLNTSGHKLEQYRETHVVVGSNTSTVPLRVVGGNKMGSLESETVKYGRVSKGTRTRKWLHPQSSNSISQLKGSGSNFSVQWLAILHRIRRYWVRHSARKPAVMTVLPRKLLRLYTILNTSTELPSILFPTQHSLRVSLSIVNETLYLSMARHPFCWTLATFAVS